LSVVLNNWVNFIPKAKTKSFVLALPLEVSSAKRLTLEAGFAAGWQNLQCRIRRSVKAPGLKARTKFVRIVRKEIRVR
jgi:hypothetical protein